MIRKIVFTIGSIAVALSAALLPLAANPISALAGAVCIATGDGPIYQYKDPNPHQIVGYIHTHDMFDAGADGTWYTIENGPGGTIRGYALESQVGCSTTG
ncbi:MAG: hypothetical protein ACREP9_17030 [Candidatus Dormibacteraceae bacterium]